MATVFLRLEHKGEGPLTERFLFNCTPRQESILRRGNRKQSSKDRVALFITLLCLTLPTDETLMQRKNVLEGVLNNLTQAIKDPLNKSLKVTPSLIQGAKAISTTFLNSPYGAFKVTRSPLSILDASSDFRVSSIIVTNDLDLALLNSLRD